MLPSSVPFSRNLFFPVHRRLLDHYVVDVTLDRDIHPDLDLQFLDKENVDKNRKFSMDPRKKRK